MPAQRLPELGEMVEVHEKHKTKIGLSIVTVICTSKGYTGTDSFLGLRSPDSKLEIFKRGNINRILEGKEADKAYNEYKNKEK